MAYRRRQTMPGSAAFEDSSLPTYGRSASFSSSSSSSVAAYQNPHRRRHSQDSNVYDYTSTKSFNESRPGFWGGLTRKAKSILDDDKATPRKGHYNQPQMHDSRDSQFKPHWSSESHQRTETPTSRKGSDVEIGGTIKNTFGERRRTIVENMAADIVQETRNLQIRTKPELPETPTQSTESPFAAFLSQNQGDYEGQLKASRDVANVMAAKAKLLLRVLKTVKADLAFAKERCAQLEEENKTLRENRQKVENPANDDDLVCISNPEDDELIRLQLEILLAEKARLAHENAIFARENRFLREIVEYHQLTMQDIVYLDDEGIEEHSEACPVDQIATFSSTLDSVPEVPSPALSTPRSPTPEPMPSSSKNMMVEPGSPTSPSSLNIIAETLREDSDLSPPSSAVKGSMQQHPDRP